MSGILLFDKPVGWTSHDAVAFLRRRLDARKVGHAGTLDPMASGLLLILVGDATRRSAELSGLDKEYRGIFELGVSTDTQDLEGRVVRTADPAAVTREALEQAMREVAGRGEQTPPIFSAVKRGGSPMYKWARKMAAAAVLDLQPRPATVHEWRLGRFDSPESEFFLRVSKGFYVRSFCHDVGETLGCGAVLTCLVRTRIGPYELRDAARPADWERNDEGLQRFFRPAP